MIRFYLTSMIILTVHIVIAQKSRVSGRVSGVDGEPIPYATVSLKNTNYSVIGDSLGGFLLPGVSAGEYILRVSSVGFKDFEKKMTLRNKDIHEEVKLERDDKSLEGVVVKQEKVSKTLEAKPISVKSIEIRDVIVQNAILTDIADRISGVRIRRSGSLGDKSDISINGVRGAAVRVYLDGLPMELMYPNFDVSTLPLSNIKRMDVYKGVLPVDVGTDAMGGAINIITEQKSYNTLRASYFLGSFNTHMADLNVGLANKKNYFVNFSGAFNYSDNNYKMKAFVFEDNKVETVRRFHDAYKMSFASVNFGTHSKKWADELRFSGNFSTGYKELQNGARVTKLAFGEVLYTAHNYSAAAKYLKSFVDDRLKLSSIFNFSQETLTYRDTTRNIYSWSGKVLKRDNQGEYAYAFNDNYTRSVINRTTLTWDLARDHKLTASNLYARQRRTGVNFVPDDEGSRDYLKYPQYLTKNITGIQYEGKFAGKLTFSAAGKLYHYDLDGVENSTFVPIRKVDDFLGYNVAFKYDFNPDLHLKASYERGFLIPNFEQFVGNGANIIRNTGLVPENSDNLNFSAGYNRKLTDKWRMGLNLNGFLREQYDVIFIGNGIFARYENEDQVHTVGMEGDLSLSYAGNWQLKTNFTGLRKTFAKVKNSNNSFLEGSTFPNNPTRFANLELEWRKSSLWSQADAFRAYVFYNYIGTFNHIVIGKNDNPKSRPELFVPTQHRLDAGVSYKFPQYNLVTAFNVVNLLDAELFDNFSVPRGGRNFNFKIIYEINNF